MDDGENSNIKSMSLNTDSIVPDMRNSISVLVGSRDGIFDSFVRINKGIRCLMILIIRSLSSNNE